MRLTPRELNREFTGLQRRHFPANFCVLEARLEYPPAGRGDGQLWIISLAASLVGNVVLFALTGLAVIDFVKLNPAASPESLKPVPDATVLISPEFFQATAGAEAAKQNPPPLGLNPEFARTSEDQRGKRPEAAAFIGERDTDATSDRAPDPTAPPLPSQKGLETRKNIETTESRYQDGELAGTSAAAPDPAMTQSPPPSPAAANNDTASPAAAEAESNPGDEAKPMVAALNELLNGPNPVDIPVSRPTPKQSPPAKQPATVPTPKTTASATPESPKPKNADPAFQGNQRKTAVVGSISRTGRSALDVADSPLGRYQAVISRAVELEWQRNCARHRDFITPGYLTIRFFVEPSGKVRTVQFVGEMETSEVQKGFTLSSIRDAVIPAMPAAVRKDFEKQPLELIFNFYF